MQQLLRCMSQEEIVQAGYTVAEAKTSDFNTLNEMRAFLVGEFSDSDALKYS